MAKILLVEDDVFIAEIYEKKLTAAGFEVENAVTGREVLKRVPVNKYDLVLLDLVLPEMSGMEVLRELKGKPAEYDANLKVVVFSNLSGPDDRAQAIQAGADGFISKTEFTPTEVVDEVKRFLKQFSEQVKNATRGEGPGAELTHPVTETPKADAKKIFLIEDEEVFAEMFGKRLRDEGYSVEIEGNGQNALKRALIGGFDLIITDVMLPGLEGREIIEQLRAATETATTPIFILSASLSDEELQEMEATKIVERSFLKTKITPSELTDAVNEHFAKE